MLDAVEVARLDRFRFDKHKHVFLVSHALLRAVLAELTGVDAAALRFAAGEHGKPYLVDVPDCPHPSFAFNLSHSGSHAVLGVWQGMGALGVDIEFHRPERRFLELSEHYFAVDEIHMLENCPAHALAARFYDIWTLKESYLKARGTGLQLSLADFAFDFREDHLDFRAEPGLDERPDRWRFWCARLPGPFSLSLALESDFLPEPELHSLIPLEAARPVAVDRLVARSR